MNEHQQSILEDQMSEMSITVGNDLIEAYKGYYENEPDLPLKEHEQKEWAILKILNHSPKERLEVYLTWNGIIGYTNRIYELATGEL